MPNRTFVQGPWISVSLRIRIGTRLAAHADELGGRPRGLICPSMTTIGLAAVMALIAALT
ncbi:MAG: hypothetical protein U0703_12775 [Anaerolineae bacterium]